MAIFAKKCPKTGHFEQKLWLERLFAVFLTGQKRAILRSHTAAARLGTPLDVRISDDEVFNGLWYFKPISEFETPINYHRHSHISDPGRVVGMFFLASIRVSVCINLHGLEGSIGRMPGLTKPLDFKRTRSRADLQNLRHTPIWIHICETNNC